MTEFEADVRRGLGQAGQKTLSAKYFYDDLGTALFDAITHLPEYGLTRAEMRLLHQHAAELPKRTPNASLVIELGSGSGAKAREILPHLTARRRITYCPIDVSAAALSRCARDLDDLSSLDIVTFEDTYIGGLRAALKLREPGATALVLFLGSSIGNFDPEVAESMLRSVRESLHAGDALLLSTDLVKPLELMLPAYDDAVGLTAAFNLNVLNRINRELSGTFVLDQFEHEARYDDAAQRIEMHLRSTKQQTASINGAFEVTFREGETIWTESSHKFQPAQVRALAERAGFKCEVQWQDAEWPFGQSLLRV
jgi:L-histidine Nalpha-methyltransferase